VAKIKQGLAAPESAGIVPANKSATTKADHEHKKELPNQAVPPSVAVRQKPGNGNATAVDISGADKAATAVTPGTHPDAVHLTPPASSAEPTDPKIGAVIQGLDQPGKKLYAELVEIAPDFDWQLEKLEKADDAQLKKQFDEYKEEDYKLGERITTILKKRRELFRKNLGLFWTIHECIVSPGFRSDLNGGKERTADHNLKMWGACTWQEFVERHSPYGLDATDKYVKEFGREYDRLVDDGISVSGQQDKGGGDAGTKKTGSSSVVKTADAKQAHLADEFKNMCNLALNSNATDEQIAATWKSKAKETCQSLTPEEIKALKMPKITQLKQSEVEKLGIDLAKLVWMSAHLSTESKEKQVANKLLVKAGVAAIIAPVPANGDAVGEVISGKAAECVSIQIAQGRPVDEKDLAQYEKWLALKGETERTISLGRELREWKAKGARCSGWRSSAGRRSSLRSWTRGSSFGPKTKPGSRRCRLPSRS